MTQTARDHADETTTQVRAAINALLLARIDAYATGDEVGADLDFAIDGLRGVLHRIEDGPVGIPTTVRTV